jgi:hypothetical protein
MWALGWAIENKVAWVRGEAGWTWNCALKSSRHAIVAQHPTVSGFESMERFGEAERAMAFFAVDRLNGWKSANKKKAEKILEKAWELNAQREWMERKAAEPPKGDPETERLKKLVLADKMGVAMAIEERRELAKASDKAMRHAPREETREASVGQGGDSASALQPGQESSTAGAARRRGGLRV